MFIMWVQNHNIKMNTILIWTLALLGLGLFVYYVPYRNIKIVQKKLDTIIELLNKKNNWILMNTFIVWHKKYIEYWKKKLNVSDYGILWIAFIKGLIIGLLIYYLIDL